ncbi:hypothetical protein SELMODRAFT_432404 [Selaginella moellendorffii]|uniref:Uncharacterized protein n=1 Tax=Selaginella moellendorffii TaxID=88036 RepID=D8TFW7_SELML|nr:hypothetical protein SELMODRAFT_432404 [Selaginella moellendorffii]
MTIWIEDSRLILGLLAVVFNLVQGIPWRIIFSHLFRFSENTQQPARQPEPIDRVCSTVRRLTSTTFWHLNKLSMKSVTLDFKRNAGVENLYQPAMYTIQELLETAARPKSYRPPVTIMAGDKDDWYYGILEIDGFVWVENHQIDQASFQEFPEEKMEVNPKKFTPSFTRAELQNNFETWKKDFAKIKMRIPNGHQAAKANGPLGIGQSLLYIMPLV